jgi:hypothetical protein
MIHILLSLAMASVFGVTAFAVYGYGVFENAWFDYAFWGVIGVGALLALIDDGSAVRRRVCREWPLAASLCRGDA